MKPQAVPVVALCLEVWRVLCPPAWKCAVLLGSEAQRVTSKAGSTRRFWAWSPLPLIQVHPYSEKNSPTRFPSCAFTYFSLQGFFAKHLFQRTATICIMSNIETHISKGLNPKLERMMLLHAVSPQGISGSCPTSVFNVVGSGSHRSSSKSRVSPMRWCSCKGHCYFDWSSWAFLETPCRALPVQGTLQSLQWSNYGSMVSRRMPMSQFQGTDLGLVCLSGFEPSCQLVPSRVRLGTCAQNKRCRLGQQQAIYGVRPTEEQHALSKEDNACQKHVFFSQVTHGDWQKAARIIKCDNIENPWDSWILWKNFHNRNTDD